ncbi:MAG: hypothetical protein ABR509_01395 [Candidatus Limnocylindria bacterium]
MPRPDVSAEFTRFGGLCAIGAGLAGLLYSVSFVVISRADEELGVLLSALSLLVGGLLSTAVYVALSEALGDADRGFARWMLVLGVAGGIGAAIHGAYDLANAINPPEAATRAAQTLPSEVDPRGFLTFAVTGLAVLIASWLIGRAGRWGRGLAWLGYLSGALLVMIYLGRLIVLDPASPLILAPAALAGFIVNPAWLIWVGMRLRRTDAGLVRTA